MQYFSLRQKINLARSILTKDSPIYVQYYVTSRCNLACQQCNIIYADAVEKEMTLDQVRRAAENLAEIGVCIVLLIGGEPFMRRDLPEVVKAFTDVGIHVRLQTNGYASREALGRCIENGAHDISVSLDSLDPAVQDHINGGRKNSWRRALESVSTINELFPENGTAFFGTVLMPENTRHIPDVVRFAREIGWGVSLVPVHVTDADRPRGFRTVHDSAHLKFNDAQAADVRRLIGILRTMRKNGFPLYDSDLYLADIVRFVSGEPVRWRCRGGGVCDSPYMYFAISPGGCLKPCCDYTLDQRHYVYDDDFPATYGSGTIHEEAYDFTRRCGGCMYGSYPEITVTARFLGPFLERFRYFNISAPVMKRLSPEALETLAADILATRPAWPGSDG
jgi:MoaA/NifB/PqqE/SkfB family radical SAM enzyme